MQQLSIYINDICPIPLQLGLFHSHYYYFEPFLPYIFFTTDLLFKYSAR